MYKFLKILISGIIGLIALDLFETVSYPIVDFVIFVVAFMGTKFVLDKTKQPDINFKNIFKIVGILFVIVLLSGA
ncbi:MAG: hypothetical protein U9R37_02870, partial [Campylobacterota bacterium]|nr:hypothetical protein [Campylobacterota bacterium]